MLRFRYRNAKGEITERSVLRWVEVGNYIRGIDASEEVFKTFRKDRIIEYFDGCESMLGEPQPDPPSLGSRATNAAKPQIVFTGFPRAQRDTLEEAARSAGLDVRQSVTKGCLFLVAGPNAGPSKTEKARKQGVYILTEPQFLALLRTGELPDDDDLGISADDQRR